MWYLAILFTVLPLLELWLLLLIGNVLGFWPTVGLTLGTAVLGAYLAKREGGRVFREWRRAMAELTMPEEGIVSGLLVLVGGVLLASPGVITDLLGLVLLFPPTRRPIARIVSERALTKIHAAAKRGRIEVEVVDAPDAPDEPKGDPPKLLPNGN